MSFRNYIAIFLLVILSGTVAVAQSRSNGSLKGKISVEKGSASGIGVSVEQNEREVASTTTDKKGAFRIDGLKPGIYDLTFRKAGLSTAKLAKVEVVAGKTRELNKNLIMPVDEGSLAVLRGSVFDPIGRSVRGAKVELARVEPDGSSKKIDGRLSNESGQFVFRLLPDVAKYRVTVSAQGAETVSKEVEVDGAAVYRVALSLKPATN
jgi:hypothetical protein